MCTVKLFNSQARLSHGTHECYWMTRSSLSFNTSSPPVCNRTRDVMRIHFLYLLLPLCLILLLLLVGGDEMGVKVQVGRGWDGLKGQVVTNKEFKSVLNFRVETKRCFLISKPNDSCVWFYSMTKRGRGKREGGRLVCFVVIQCGSVRVCACVCSCACLWHIGI